MSKTKHTERLASINSKIVSEGEILPAVTLKDGSIVQTGTVATLLHNIRLYNAGERSEIQKELKLAIPSLIKVGLFDLFPPDEWINTNNEGRKFVGVCAKKYLESTEK